MTEAMFDEWFNWFFVPFKRQYAASLGIEQKCILLMDNAPVHGRNINGDVPDVEVLFLPPNTTSLLQPMDQSVNRVFKSIYLKKLMRRAIEASDAGQDLNEFFSSMEIDTAIELVHSAWQDVPEHTIARSFSKCHPDNTSELVDRKEKTAKEAAKLLKEDAEFCQLNRRMEAPYNLSDIEAMLTETTEDLVDISTLTQEQIATVRRAMGIVVEPESGTPAGGPVQTDEHRHKRQKTDNQGDDVVASLEDSPDVSGDSFDMSLYEPDTLKRDVCKLYNAIATADTGTRSRYHSFVNDLAHLISSVSKN